MSTIKIGAMRYDVVADTSKFDKPMKATRGELNSARRAFNETRTPAEKYAQSITKINNLYQKNLIDTTTYRRSLSKARNEFKANTREVSRYDKALSGLETRMGSMAAGFVGFGLASTALQTVSESLGSLDDLAKASRKVGVAAEDLKAFQIAGAELAGIENEAVNNAIQRYVVNLSKAAQGTGDAVRVFENLNLDAVELNAMGAAESLGVVADAIAAMPNENDRLEATMTLMGRSGGDMVNVMNEGADALKGFREQVEKFNLAGSGDEGRQRVEAFNDSVGRLSQSIEGLKNEAAESAATMTPLVERMADFVRHYRETQNINTAGALAVGIPLLESANAQRDAIANVTGAQQAIQERTGTTREALLTTAIQGVMERLVSLATRQADTLDEIERKTQPAEAL